MAALVQQAWAGNREAMVAATGRAIRQAAGQGAQLVVCQELHTSAYFCQQELVGRHDLAEPIPGPSSDHFGALAKELAIVLVISLFERRAPGLSHHTAVVLERDGSIAGIYRKMHIPDDPGFYEKFYFTPGDLGFEPIATSVGRLGVLVCWDQWFPEAARLMALAGADLLLYPTAIGWSPNDSPAEQARQREAWITVQRGHAVANGLPVLVANRCGHELDPEARRYAAGGPFCATGASMPMASCSSAGVPRPTCQHGANLKGVWRPCAPEPSTASPAKPMYA